LPRRLDEELAFTFEAARRFGRVPSARPLKTQYRKNFSGKSNIIIENYGRPGASGTVRRLFKRLTGNEEGVNERRKIKKESESRKKMFYAPKNGYLKQTRNEDLFEFAEGYNILSTPERSNATAPRLSSACRVARLCPL
jgi:hypothetical protein